MSRPAQINIPSEILRTVVTMDALGSLSKAAQKLGLSQPAISAHLKRLNAIVGGPIFDTASGSTQATPLGKIVVVQARKFLKANDQILSLGGATEKDLPLRLGLPSLYTKEFLTAWQRAGGGQNVAVTAAYSSLLSASFVEGLLDVVCLTGPPVDLGTPKFEWEENLAWVRARDFVLPPGRPIPIVALAGNASDQPMIAALEKAALSYRIAFSSSDKDARYAAVHAKYGITVLPERYVPDYLTIAKDYYLPKLPPVRVGVFVSTDCDTGGSATLVQTVRGLAPPNAQAGSVQAKRSGVPQH
jgi:DNA-binding transcriptional LysR family regulator